MLLSEGNEQQCYKSVLRSTLKEVILLLISFQQDGGIVSSESEAIRHNIVD